MREVRNAIVRAPKSAQSSYDDNEAHEVLSLNREDTPDVYGYVGPIHREGKHQAIHRS